MKKFKHSHAILWGATIITAALLNAPVFLTLIVLPTVAVIALNNNSIKNYIARDVRSE